MTRSDKTKLAQVVAFLLRGEPSGRMNYMRLIKLLYMADRQSLKETAETITHSRFVAMERGPVLSELYDYIMGKCEDFPAWQKFFQRVNYELVLANDPGASKLCAYETRLLDSVKERYKNDDEFDMVEITHELEEWKRNEPREGTMNPIPPEDLLEAVGRSEDKDWIEEKAKDRHFLASLAEGGIFER